MSLPGVNVTDSQRKFLGAQHPAVAESFTQRQSVYINNNAAAPVPRGPHHNSAMERPATGISPALSLNRSQNDSRTARALGAASFEIQPGAHQTFQQNQGQMQQLQNAIGTQALPAHMQPQLASTWTGTWSGGQHSQQQHTQQQQQWPQQQLRNDSFLRDSPNMQHASTVPPSTRQPDYRYEQHQQQQTQGRREIPPHQSSTSHTAPSAEPVNPTWQRDVPSTQQRPSPQPEMLQGQKSNTAGNEGASTSGAIGSRDFQNSKASPVGVKPGLPQSGEFTISSMLLQKPSFVPGNATKGKDILINSGSFSAETSVSSP